jgi:hypothetical protein
MNSTQFFATIERSAKWSRDTNAKGHDRIMRASFDSFEGANQWMRDNAPECGSAKECRDTMGNWWAFSGNDSRGWITRGMITAR